MNAFTYDASENCVYWETVRLSEESIEDLFAIFIREGAAVQFNQLHDAHLLAGGIERVSGLRRAA